MNWEERSAVLADLALPDSLPPSQLLSFSPLHGIICTPPSLPQEEPFLYKLNYEEKITLSFKNEYDISESKIDTMQCNTQGNIILFSGKQSAFISVIPRRSTSSPQWGMLPVHERFFAERSSAQILKASWHTSSPKHFSLLVKNRENVIFFLFDISTSLEVPEKEIYLNSSNKNILPKPHKDAVITSFCFSAQTSGWDQFSVYFLTNTGEIFSLCPLIPENMVIHASRITDLFDAEDVKQAQWESVFGDYTGDVLKTKKIPSSLLRLQLEGPLLWIPDKIHHGKDTREEWDSLVPYSRHGAPLVLLKSQRNSGLIHCCMQVMPSVPCFRKGHARVILFNIIDLEIPTPSDSSARCTITCQPTYETFFVHHWCGVHQVFITLPNLENPNLVDAEPRCSVDRLSGVPQTESVLGLAVWQNDAHLSHTILVWTSTGLLSFPLSLRKKKSGISFKESLVESTRQTAQEKLAELTLAYKLPVSVPKNLVPKQGGMDASFLQQDLPTLQLHQTFLERNHLAFLEKAECAIEESLDLFEEDKQQHVEKEKALRKSIRQVTSKIEEQAEKLAKYKHRQHNLEERISILFRLLNYSQSKLSTREHQFIKDLQFFHSDAKDLQHRVKQLEKKIDAQQILSSGDTSTRSGLTRKKKEEVKEKLGEHTQSIKGFQKLISSLENEVL